MTTSRDTFEPLLEVQAYDTSADQLRYRRGSLAEIERLKVLDRRRAELERETAAESARRDAVVARQRAFETDLTATEGRLAALEHRLYSGTVTVARDLQAMEAERDSLRRRAGALEDDVLAAMTEAEPLDKAITAMADEVAAIGVETARLRADVATAQSTIDAELAATAQARSAVAAVVPTDLMGLYEKLRARLGGVGVARLTNGRCGGCHLALSATEVDSLHKQPPGTVVQCEQCTRILAPPA